MTNYHTIVTALINTDTPDSLESEHNRVVMEFARSPQLQAAAARVLQIKSRDSREAAGTEKMLLAITSGERSWSAAGGHDAAAINDRLQRECRLLSFLSGTAAHRWNVSWDGYLTWGDALRAIVE